MDLQEFKSHNIRQRIGIDEEKFGKVFIFVDFANVDKWFAEDNRDWDNNILESNSKLSVDLETLLSFSRCFSDHIRFYYGHNPQNVTSLKFLGKTKYVFGAFL